VQGSDGAQLDIPNSLQESLAARVHDLGRAGSLLHLGATMGREFSHAWLAAASELSPAQLSECLAELADREILFKRGVGDSVTYAFKHALIRDAVYNSMLPSRRRECHLAVARVLENRFPVQAERSPELLAQHYSASEHTPENLHKALEYWLKAAANAAPRSANIEADHFLNRALADLRRMPKGEERDLFEVAIQSKRIPLLGALHGYGSTQMREASERALALMEVVEDFEVQFMALFSVCVFYMVGGQHNRSFEAAEKIAAICENQPVAYRLEAHMLLGLNYFFQGELAQAKENLQEAIALYDRDQHGGEAYLLGQDPEIVAMAYLGWVYAVSGEFDQLPAHCEALLERADSLGHPNSSGYALTFTAWARIYVGDIDKIGELLDKLESMSEKYGLGWSSIQVGILRAFLRCHRERDPKGLEDFEQALSAWRSIGSQCFIARWDTYYALASLEAGELERVAEAIARAEGEIEVSEEFWVQSEIPRCRGRLAAATGEEELAHTSFQHSLSLAARRQAWGLNLVTACDYAEFLLPRDKSRAASILQDALARVSLCSDSALEQRAQALSERLSSQ
jgi:tetratricopeptide (TPR) repeat protein